MAVSQTLVSRVTGSYKSGPTRRPCLSGLNSEKPFLIFVDEFIMRPPGETYYFQVPAFGSLVAAHTGLNKTFHLHTRSLPAASLYDLSANYKAAHSESVQLYIVFELSAALDRIIEEALCKSIVYEGHKTIWSMRFTFCSWLLDTSKGLTSCVLPIVAAKPPLTKHR